MLVCTRMSWAMNTVSRISRTSSASAQFGPIFISVTKPSSANLDSRMFHVTKLTLGDDPSNGFTEGRSLKLAPHANFDAASFSLARGNCCGLWGCRDEFPGGCRGCIGNCRSCRQQVSVHVVIVRSIQDTVRVLRSTTVY